MTPPWVLSHRALHSFTQHSRASLRLRWGAGGECMITASRGSTHARPSMLGTLNSLIFFNNLSVVTGLTEDADFMQDLFQVSTLSVHCSHTHIHAHTHTHIRTFRHIHTHTHTHTHIGVASRGGLQGFERLLHLLPDRKQQQRQAERHGSRHTRQQAP
jgi:uncharacterized protein with NAD-binding domain and iron-sulfur cluster